MRKILIAVDDTRSCRAVQLNLHNLMRVPEEIVLVNVQRPEGKSLMTEMLGDAELSTLKDSLEGTEHKEALNLRSRKILEYYRKELDSGGRTSIKTITRMGRPAEEILKVAEEERAELIVMGFTGKKGFSRLISGSVSKEVQDRAKVPVFLARTPLMCEEPYSWRDAYAAVTVFMAVFLGLFLLATVLQKGPLMP